ncbi:hypothetical protein QFC21_006906 [Naganishia friedmannii]|uniref:Uncharacterized protein n=1 Tax=Naganishia friedmannii TaxID=89922 RepID=A0ACC2UZU7_9TREE|nr:hypothetical protein QFC21_006906 [Naganishia friedmannii]
MSMLGSPIAGAPYLFIDPASVWSRSVASASASKESQQNDAGSEARRPKGVDDAAPPVLMPVVRILVPSEDGGGKVQRKRTFPAVFTHVTSTPFGSSSQQSRPAQQRYHHGQDDAQQQHHPHNHAPVWPVPSSGDRDSQRQYGDRIPGFMRNRTLRLPAGAYELFAIDAWVLDRRRRVKCVVVCSGGVGRAPGKISLPTAGGKEKERRTTTRTIKGHAAAEGGVMVDEYIPIPPLSSSPSPTRTANEHSNAAPDDAYSSPSETSDIDNDIDIDDHTSRQHPRRRRKWTWRDSLDVFRREVERDGGRLVDLDLPAASLSSELMSDARSGRRTVLVDGDGDESPHGTSVTAQRDAMRQPQQYQQQHTTTDIASSRSTPTTRTTTPPQSRTTDPPRTLIPLTPLPYLSHGLHPIPIPGGSYAEVRERLFVNLNLGRGGFAGRSWVGLEVPSKATEHKFLIQYRLPPLPTSTTTTTRETSGKGDREGASHGGDGVGEEKGRAIQEVVLELGKLIQTALWIHGLYGHPEITAFGGTGMHVHLDNDDDGENDHDHENGYVDGYDDAASWGGPVGASRRGEEEVQDGLLCDSTMLALGIWKTGVNQFLEGTMSFSSSPSRTTSGHSGSITGTQGGGGAREFEQTWGMEQGEWEDLCMDPVRRRVRVDAMTDEFTSQGPNLTALLLSEVISVRCKLAALDINVPRDPFGKPGELLLALREYQRAFHPSRTTTDYLTPRLLEEINISYAKAQVHESGKLSRIMKGKVAQASAGFASNLTGLASATLGSATSTGRYHGASDDEGSDKNAQEVTVAGAVEKGSASNLATANIDRWVSCIKSGKEGLGNGRVGDLWLGKVGNGQGKQWQWDTPRKVPIGASSSDPKSSGVQKRRNTHGPHSGQLVRDRTSSTGHRHVSAESQQQNERLHTKRHSIHGVREPDSRRLRTKASLSHGAGHLRNMTSKTGHALRDGLSNVTSLARKGFEFGDQSDSDPDRDLSLISTDMASLDSNARYPNISITATAPSDDTSSRTYARPGRLQSRSVSQFADSEAFSEGISDVTSYLTRPAQRSILESITDAGTPTVHSSKSSLLYTKLERMVSMDARYGAISPGQGIEFLHSGHDERTWLKWRREQHQKRGISRRYSFESKPPVKEVVRQHPKQLALDVNACGLVWRLHTEEIRLRREVDMMTEMEAIMQRVSRELVDEFRSRRQLLDQLQSSAATLVSPTPQEVDEDVAKDELSVPQSTSGHAQKLLNKLATDGNDLEYSVRNLQNTVRSIGDAASKIDLWMTEFPPEIDCGKEGTDGPAAVNAPTKAEWTGSVLDNVPGDFICSASEKTSSDDDSAGSSEHLASTPNEITAGLFPWLRSLWQR